MNPQNLQKSFDSGEYIFKEAEPAECVYLIDSGRVEISLERDGRKAVIDTINEGEIFGEMALVDQLPRSASARAIIPTTVTEIPLNYIRQKITQSDPTIRMFLRFFMARYKDLDTRVSEVLETLSLPQAETLVGDDGSKTMELRSLASQLVEMKGRIDTAITKPSEEGHNTPYSEETMEISKVLLTEEMLLRSAIANKEFSLQYQPIIDLVNMRIAGCEALVRWKHPSGELLLPSRFLSQIEKTDLMIELGYWIAEEACRFQNRIFSQLDYDLFVAINLSGKQFDDQLLIQSLDKIIDNTGASRERIKFEITESLLIDNPELATESLNQLSDIGVKLAIDDFGTGYSSFSYLYRFPFDTLKIDRVFVSSMSQSAKSEQIVKSLINLSDNLGIEVVAEGIESERELGMLREYNTAYGQGFYFSKPVNESDFIELLREPQAKLA